MALEDDMYEVFAQGLAFGFTPGAAAEEAGFDWGETQARMESRSPDVVKRVNELVTYGNFDLSNEHIRIANQLEVDRDFAYKLGNPAAAINATVQRAKLLGVFVERTIVDNNLAVTNPNQLTDEEWEAKFGDHQEKENG